MMCSICNEDFEGHGHNAEPINDGRCCDFCNMAVVIPTRINDSVEIGSLIMRNRQRTVDRGNN